MEDYNGRFLMIQNEGVCPPEGFTMFGVSTARETDIGHFGSGNKHGVNVCLRHDITPIIYCGNLRLHFLKVEKTMNGVQPKRYHEVHCHYSGKLHDGKNIDRVDSLSIALEYGKEEWTELAMALREFVSNAIDQTAQRLTEAPDWAAIVKDSKLAVKVVEANQVRAKAGYTRVFLPYTPEVQKFYDELGKRFLHFSEPQMLSQRVLEKRGRNLEGQGAMIYRRGVFVREVSDKPSLFDYNFDSEITLDESRNVDDYTVKSSAVRAVRLADSDTLRKIFLALLDGRNMWEASFDAYYLNIDNNGYSLTDEQKAAHKKNWKDAWDIVAPDHILAYHTDEKGISRATRKGVKVKTIQAYGWAEAAKANSVPTPGSVLDAYEQNGHEVIPAQGHAEVILHAVWRLLESLDMTAGKSRPEVKSFRVLPGGLNTSCFYDNGTLFVNSDLTYNATSMAQALEETLRHFAGPDNAKLQVLLSQVATKVAMKAGLLHF